MKFLSALSCAVVVTLEILNVWIGCPPSFSFFSMYITLEKIWKTWIQFHSVCVHLYPPPQRANQPPKLRFIREFSHQPGEIVQAPHVSGR